MKWEQRRILMGINVATSRVMRLVTKTVKPTFLTWVVFVCEGVNEGLKLNSWQRKKILCSEQQMK